MDPLTRAISAAGGVTNLAHALGVRQSVVGNWRGRGRVPAERVLAIEALTGVSRYDLRPDVFGSVPVAQGEAS